MFLAEEAELNYIDCIGAKTAINRALAEYTVLKGFDVQILCVFYSATHRLRRNVLTASDLILYSGSFPIHVYNSIESLLLGDENAPLKLAIVQGSKAKHYELTEKGKKIVKYAARLAGDYSRQLDLLKNESSDIEF